MVEFESLKGKILTNIEKIGDEELVFSCADGKQYKMNHQQECCESVYIADINGDFADLLNEPILIASVDTNNTDPDEYGSITWTFYRLATKNGFLDIRWCGSSNGYYSESVDFFEI